MENEAEIAEQNGDETAGAEDAETASDEDPKRASDEGDEAASGDESEVIGAPLTRQDLIPDQALENAADDRFQHTALARRVSELVACATTPLNVALFGPWGSGKSSLAGLIREQLQGGQVAFVYYNAWKFGGKSLRRNFITNAAIALDLPQGKRRWEKYHEGLYQSKRRARFHTRDAWRAIRALIVAFLVVLFLLLLLLGAALTIASTFTDRNAIGEIEKHLPDYLAPGGTLALLVAALTATIAVGRVDIDQSALSHEEEFTQRFRELIDDGLAGPKQHWWRKPRYERIVFFIDELDRCDEKDVVETLVAIRTFLDENDCVFVVAADRDVLETALQREVKQATPTDVIDPYYTTAGAFLDKIFGHQLDVPPIRGRRLTRFARDLVRDRGGLWREIVDAGGQSALDSVIYALIPAHVRSPRRIKVLLNNFATNARVAEGRGISWPYRGEEIAKLTALQTEFPSLAGDLVVEPRLPNFLLNPDDSAISDRARPLVKRHRVDEGGRETETEDPGPYLDEQRAGTESEADSERRKEMRRRHRSQLRRYLERTDSVPNPQRDLLYLEAAGAAVDLEDPELGELIEEKAPEAPSEVVSAVQGRDEKEQVAAIRLLADIAQDTIAKEQTNVVSAMMELTSSLGVVLSDQAAEDVANSLRLFSRDKNLETGHLVGALAIALHVADDELEEAVASRDDLWNDPEHLKALAKMLPTLPEELVDRLLREIANALSADPSVLAVPLAELDERDANKLLEAQVIREAAKLFLADSTVDIATRGELADQMLRAALDE